MSDRDGWWEQVLDRCRSDRPREIPTYRFVVCGNIDAGKRMLAATLRDSLTFGERTVHRGGKRQWGTEYSYVDVRRADGSMLHTVELVVVDFPELVDVALPTGEQVGRSIILICCDITDPTSCTASVAKWAEAVNRRVTALVPDTAESLLATRLKVLDATRQALSAEMPESDVPPEMATDFDLRLKKAVCLLPTFVVGTKLDLLDRLPSTQVAVSPTVKLPPSRLLRDYLRAAAARIGAAVALVAKPNTPEEGEFVRALADFMVSSAASRASVPETAGIMGAVGYEFAAGRLLPAGADKTKSIIRPISGEALAPSAAFSANDGSGVGGSGSGDGAIESHGEILKAFAGGQLVGVAGRSARKPAKEDKDGSEDGADWDNFLDE